MTKKMFFVCLFFYVFFLGVQIRLAGSTHCSGRVELFYGSTWGTVCDDDWDLRDAEVVCRQLSCGKALSAPGSASFGEGADPILLDNVACSGSERSLTACQFSEMGKHNCKHSEDAGVVCSGKNLFVTNVLKNQVCFLKSTCFCHCGSVQPVGTFSHVKAGNHTLPHAL
uniref:Soluble scavenger receptor cysteine-rich domain-containing protein SSC5D n=1 Tax=Labrus bergylta TaxID=56723 RepID=A0A3Q3EHH7_9LABR